MATSPSNFDQCNFPRQNFWWPLPVFNPLTDLQLQSGTVILVALIAVVKCQWPPPPASRKKMLLRKLTSFQLLRSERRVYMPRQRAHSPGGHESTASNESLRGFYLCPSSKVSFCRLGGRENKHHIGKQATLSERFLLAGRFIYQVRGQNLTPGY